MQLPLCQTPVNRAIQLMNGQSIWIKDETQVHPIWGGNKWRKLKGHLIEYQRNTYAGIVSFGGAWSNHLHALSHICAELHIPLRMIIRGERPQNLSATLREAELLGTELIFVSRSDYKAWSELPERLHTQFKGWYIVPEGGGGEAGRLGCIEMGAEIPKTITDVVVAAGTGTTAHGVRFGLNPQVRLHIISALKTDIQFLAELEKIPHTYVYRDAHEGGYARITPDVVETIAHVKTQHNVLLDPVYTAKAWMRMQKILETHAAPNSEWMFIHTGGLQGLRGYPMLAGWYK